MQPSSTDNNLLRPPEAEIKAVEQAIGLTAATGCSTHFFHISTEGAMQSIIGARRNGIDLTCGVCPHHLFFLNTDAQRDPALFKVYPPLRPNEDAEYLLDALRNGEVDVLQSDHAPHLLSEKRKSFAEAPAGLPGVQELLSAGLELVAQKLISLKTLEKLLCHNRRRIHGIKKAEISLGSTATFTLVDPDSETVFRSENVVSRAGWSAYEGVRFSGTVKHVIYEGMVVVQDGRYMLASGRADGRRKRGPQRA
ncbi:MAG: dihydroorotase family protein [Planctomycetota bacterium]|nr:dihydroorotase family protein [Planctomycetota bacterium]